MKCEFDAVIEKEAMPSQNLLGDEFVSVDKTISSGQKNGHNTIADSIDNNSKMDFSGIDFLTGNDAIDYSQPKVIEVSENQLNNITEDTLAPLTADEAVFLDNIQMITDNELLNNDLFELIIKNRINRKKMVAVIIIAFLLIFLILSLFLANYFMGSADYHIRLAEKYISANRQDDALREYNAARERDTANAEAYIKSAEIYHSMGNIDNAIDILHNGYESTGNEEIWKLYLVYTIEKGK